MYLSYSLLILLSATYPLSDTQRHHRRIMERKSAEKSSLTQERIDLLDQLGFSWLVKAQSVSATWDQRLEELTEFVSEHGHFRIDPDAMPHLHAWVVEQKQKLDLSERSGGEYPQQGEAEQERDPFYITAERVAALKAIGFTSTVELEAPENSLAV
jgi:hypothetical protein